MKLGRIIVAFLVAPLMTPIVFIIAALVNGVFDMPEQIPGYFLLYGSFAYLAATIFGIPAYFLYRALDWTNILLFIVGGAIIGFMFSFFIIEGYPAYIFWLRLGDRLWCVLAGGLSALVFRMILSGLNFGERKRVPIGGET